MKNATILICVSGMLTMIGCTATYEVKNESFEINDNTTWSIDLPTEWKRLSAAEIKEIEGTGQDAIEESLGGEIEPFHSSLFFIEKDDYNSILANTQPYDSLFESYEEEQIYVFDAIIQTYGHEGMNYDYEMGMDTLDGLVFKTMSVDIFEASNKRDLILSQMIWDRLFENRSIMITINSNNDADKKAMIDWVKKSKFQTSN